MFKFSYFIDPDYAYGLTDGYYERDNIEDFDVEEGKFIEDNVNTQDNTNFDITYAFSVNNMFIINYISDKCKKMFCNNVSGESFYGYYTSSVIEDLCTKRRPNFFDCIIHIPKIIYDSSGGCYNTQYFTNNPDFIESLSSRFVSEIILSNIASCYVTRHNNEWIVNKDEKQKLLNNYKAKILPNRYISYNDIRINDYITLYFIVKKR